MVMDGIYSLLSFSDIPSGFVPALNLLAGMGLIWAERARRQGRILLIPVTALLFVMSLQLLVLSQPTVFVLSQLAVVACAAQEAWWIVRHNRSEWALIGALICGFLGLMIWLAWVILQINAHLSLGLAGG